MDNFCPCFRIFLHEIFYFVLLKRISVYKVCFMSKVSCKKNVYILFLHPDLMLFVLYQKNCADEFLREKSPNLIDDYIEKHMRKRY